MYQDHVSCAPSRGRSWARAPAVPDRQDFPNGLSIFENHLEVLRTPSLLIRLPSGRGDFLLTTFPLTVIRFLDNNPSSPADDLGIRPFAAVLGA